MSLDSGTRLGPYKIVEQIGEGGQGAVYRATDTRLDRTVAIKVLPEHLAGDSQRLARFQREAQTISSLNHPHICALHDVGDQDGTHFLVMEYVEGEALDQRLKRGPMPVDAALDYAKQIADALDKAHQQGIVHRDLKPANVMITKSGVKLLDFGLAKLSDDAESANPFSEIKTKGGSELTAEGTIMGTFRYMAPEQVEGREVDARTDIYALCLVIYEMITGERAVNGETQASLIAAILKDTPRPLTDLVPLTPRPLDRVVETGLEKDPDKRWQSARELKHALEWIGSEAVAPSPAARSPMHDVIWKGIAAAAAVALVVVTWALWPNRVPEMRVDISTPPTLDPGSFALSPSGDRIVFAADDEGRTRLWLRAFGSGSDREVPLDGTEGASMPFWSPDGESVGFFAGGQLKTLDLAGGSPQILAPVTFADGASWADGVILFGPGGGGTIQRIAAFGGERAPAVSTPDLFNGSPWFLPDGRQFLFFNAGGGRAGPGIYLGTLGSTESRFLTSADSPAAFHPAGYLMFIRQGDLWAQGFDPASGDPTGELHRVAADITSFSISRSGHVAYGRAGTVGVELRWFDRTGEPGEAFASDLAYPVISPDGTRIAAIQGGDIWVLNADLSQPRKVTFDAAPDLSPVFSPDGSRIAFAAFRDVVQIHEVSASGSGGESVMLADGGVPADWLPEVGLLYSDVTPPNVDLRILGVDETVTDFLADPEIVETRGQVSPNGRWVAYEQETLETPPSTEIMVRPFPDASAGGRSQVSASGGRYVRWSADGTELFYLTRSGTLMRVAVDSEGPIFGFQTAEPLFDARMSTAILDSVMTPYDVSSDGRFLMTVGSTSDMPAPIHLLLNWRPDD